MTSLAGTGRNKPRSFPISYVLSNSLSLDVSVNFAGPVIAG